MHRLCEPSILYFGTPVVVISTKNEDGTSNLAPMSSVFWLGWRCMLGMSTKSKTVQNMLRTRECVLNLPSDREVEMVDRLALTTGSCPVPENKIRRGYRYVANKFQIAGLTPMDSDTVKPPRVQEFPIHLEAVLEAVHPMVDDDAAQRGGLVGLEVRIRRVFADERILVTDEPNHIDPDKWRPLIMSFQKFYGLSEKQVHSSNLSTIPESSYRSPDVDRSRLE